MGSITHKNFLTTKYFQTTVCPLYCKDVPSFDSSLSVCHILSGGHMIGFVFHFPFFCIYVPCAVKMFHLLTAACQYVSYFVRRTNSWLCFSVFCIYICPLCCKNVSSFDSSLSICVIFCQVDKRLALFFPFFVCMYVPCAVKMLHLLTAACQYLSYFVRWKND